MKRKFPKLHSPLQIGGVRLKNRIISAPMTYPVLTADGCLTPEAIAFYELRARGGAGVVTVSELIVHSKTGKYYPIQVTIDAPGAKDSLAAAARAVKRHGAVASMELSHGGKFAITDGPAWGPVDEWENGRQTVIAMTDDMISEILDAYARSAALCRDAGFEMLLIHAGHGWLLQQFLSPATNTRTDKYGGSIENRARLTLEVIDRVRAVVGPDFPLEVRMSAEEYYDGGYAFDEACRFAELIAPKIDLLQVSTGSHKGSFDRTHLSMFAERGANVRYAEEIKKRVSVPVAAIGALNEPDMLEDVIASGRADAVVMGRALLADPYLPRKSLEGRDDEIVRCCRCFTCMAERLTTGLRICALNPVIGSEYEMAFAPQLAKPKRVLIAGGGPAGMQCAITAAERGHEVILCEKTSRLGGALNAERGVPFKRDLYKFIEVKALQMKNAGVDVRLGTAVTPELVREISPDALVIAVGSSPVVPPIPGVDRAGAHLADNLPEREAALGDNVAVLGGGLVGCETALHLSMLGKRVTIVELRDDICVDANPRHRPLLLAQMEGAVTVLKGTRAVRVEDGALICQTQDGEISVPADDIIIAAGRSANRDVSDALRDAAPYVCEIGDCVRPKNVCEAVFRGHFAALDI